MKKSKEDVRTTNEDGDFVFRSSNREVGSRRCILATHGTSKKAPGNIEEHLDQARAGTKVCGEGRDEGSGGCQTLAGPGRR